MLWIFRFRTLCIVQIFCYNQIPHPPCLLSEDALGCETTTCIEYTLPFKGDRSAAPVLLLVPLGCTLMEQPIDNQRCLAEQDQWSWLTAGTEKKVGASRSYLLFRETPGAEVHIFQRSSCYHMPIQNPWKSIWLLNCCCVSKPHGNGEIWTTYVCIYIRLMGLFPAESWGHITPILECL